MRDIVLWILIGIKNLGMVNTVAMSALFILTIILSFVIFTKGTMQNISGENITFGAAVELSVAMPISWLPLISDYTREAKKPLKSTAVSVITYGVVSCWMYVIGMGAAIFLPLADITDFLYFIGSVFAPMIAIQIADFFILNQNKEATAFSVQNLVIWLIGFVVYRLLMRMDIIVGNTLLDMLITIMICVFVFWGIKYYTRS